MATIKQGALGGFKGKLGPAVGYSWKGRACMRSMPSKYRDRKTPQQEEARQRFAVLSRLASQMLPAAALGLRGVAAEAMMSEMNYFMRLNKQCVTMTEGVPSIDHARLRLSEGDLPPVQFDTPQSTSARGIGVDFHDDPLAPGDGGDYVYLFAYADSMKDGILSLPAYRYSRHIDMALPACWTGHSLHLYGFAWDSDTRATGTTYLGRFAP